MVGVWHDVWRWNGGVWVAINNRQHSDRDWRHETLRESHNQRMGGGSDSEREAQRAEFLKRESKNAGKSSKPQTSSHNKRILQKSKTKTATFKELLDITNDWLEEAFPHLFAADEYLPLDEHVVRDLKNEYKNNHVKKNYPKNVVIKAAIARYKVNPGYLACLKEGASKFAFDGTITGKVTKQEEEEAQKLLKTI